MGMSVRSDGDSPARGRPWRDMEFSRDRRRASSDLRGVRRCHEV